MAKMTVRFMREVSQYLDIEVEANTRLEASDKAEALLTNDDDDDFYHQWYDGEGQSDAEICGVFDETWNEVK